MDKPNVASMVEGLDSLSNLPSHLVGESMVRQIGDMTCSTLAMLVSFHAIRFQFFIGVISLKTTNSFYSLLGSNKLFLFWDK